MGPSSSLLGLPPELRNHIFALVLSRPSPIIISGSRPAPAPPALLQVCMQVKAEATALYHNCNAFHLCVAPNSCKSKNVLHWINSLERKSAQAIEVLVISPDMKLAKQLEELAVASHYQYMTSMEDYLNKYRGFCRALLRVGIRAERVNFVSRAHPLPASRVGGWISCWLQRFTAEMGEELEKARATVKV